MADAPEPAAAPEPAFPDDAQALLELMLANPAAFAFIAGPPFFLRPIWMRARTGLVWDPRWDALDGIDRMKAVALAWAQSLNGTRTSVVELAHKRAVNDKHWRSQINWPGVVRAETVMRTTPEFNPLPSPDPRELVEDELRAMAVLHRTNPQDNPDNKEETWFPKH